MPSELNQRSRDIFRSLVDAYLEKGEPVGSKTLAGLLISPHTSAGRIPTEKGLKLFVEGLLEIGSLDPDERHAIEARCKSAGDNLENMLAQASATLSGLSKCAGVVVAPKLDAPLKHIEFVPLNAGRALVVLVMANGAVENRIIDIPLGTLPSSLTEATNYLNRRMQGKTVEEASALIKAEINDRRAQLNESAERLVAQGLAAWGGGKKSVLIVKGQANLLDDIQALDDLERVRSLFGVLEAQESMAKLLDLTRTADGIQIYIGSENSLFTLSGCSMITAPFRNGGEKIVGAVGIIGPTRMNYARIIPLVDYTSRVVSKLIG